jgi:hypothetical protein
MPPLPRYVIKETVEDISHGKNIVATMSGILIATVVLE